MTTNLWKDPTKDEESNRRQLFDLSIGECAAVAGGMKKLPFQQASTKNLLTTPDGEPVQVYVDGVLINSVTDGFVHL
jgi:c-di-GMP-binding flagellar brake protein YcgR